MAPARSFSLRFLAGTYQGGSVQVEWGREVVIGRAPGVDVQLEDDLTSRRHARIGWEAGQPVIEDLASTNGTFVNGERVRRRRLNEGDRVLLGGNILKVVGAAGADPIATTTLEAPTLDGALERTSADDLPRRTSAMQGRLEEVGLPDLLQLLGTSRKTGLLALRDGERRAEIHLERGRVVGCRVDGQGEGAPRQAFLSLLTWGQGSFELGPPGQVPPGAVLDESTEALLLDGLRVLDEARRS